MQTSNLKNIPGGTSFLGDSGQTEGSLFASLLPYVIMIILLPIASFFFARKSLFQDILGYSDTLANVYGAVSAVLILHILLAVFIYKAFTDTPTKQQKQD